MRVMSSAALSCPVLRSSDSREQMTHTPRLDVDKSAKFICTCSRRLFYPPFVTIAETSIPVRRKIFAQRNRPFPYEQMTSWMLFQAIQATGKIPVAVFFRTARVSLQRLWWGDRNPTTRGELLSNCTTARGQRTRIRAAHDGKARANSSVPSL